MRRRHTLFSLLLLAGLLAGSLVSGAARADDEVPAPKPPAPERDPFSPSGRVRDASQTPPPPRFVPQEAPDALPQLALRGYVEDADGKTVALLEVNGAHTYLVREGDTVSLPVRGRNAVIRVSKVSNLALHVEVGELRREVVVR